MPMEPQNMLAWVMTTNKPNQQRKFTLLFIDLYIAEAYYNWIFAKISRLYLTCINSSMLPEMYKKFRQQT